MTEALPLPQATLDRIAGAELIGVRVADSAHRPTPIWAVVLDRRAYVRSWSQTAGGWNAQVRTRPAELRLGDRDVAVAVAARPVNDERLLSRIGDAYRTKYGDQLPYVGDMMNAAARATTLELTAAGP